MSWVSWSRGGVGPLALFADGYGLRLAQSGFTANSVVIHLTVMGQLSRWMSGNGLELLSPVLRDQGRDVGPEHLSSFVAVEPLCASAPEDHPTVRGLADYGFVRRPDQGS